MKQDLTLVFSATTEGGLAEHIYYQTRNLSSQGRRVLMLAPKGFLPKKSFAFPVRHVLYNMPSASLPVLLRRLLQVAVLCGNYFILAYYTWRKKPRIILIDSYREYLAGIWSWILSAAIRSTRSVCVVNLHDPVRDYIVGPLWWHKWSVKCGYSFVDIALVHAAVNEKANLPDKITVVEVPVGIYDLPEPSMSRIRVREKWNVKPDQTVFLSFGFIRDNKNLDLLLKALIDVKNAFLVIAGNSQSGSDRPIVFYESLIKEYNLADRCILISGFISEDKVGDFFIGSDFVALTYSASFHSQSGVLNLAAAARLPVLASAAESPLIRTVKAYDLGIVIEPDSSETIVQGMKSLISQPPFPQWEQYYQYAGWENNVNRMLAAIDKLTAARKSHN